MSESWVCPRCGRAVLEVVGLGVVYLRPPFRLEEPGPAQLLSAQVCLRCAGILWHRLQKVLRPFSRTGLSVPGGNDAEETGPNPRAVGALPAR